MSLFAHSDTNDRQLSGSEIAGRYSDPWLTFPRITWFPRMTNTIQATSTDNVVISSYLSQQEANAWKPLAAFILFAITIALVGYAVFQSYKEEMKIDAQHDLGGIASLKIDQITHWMAERRSDAQAHGSDSLLLAEVDRWLQRGGQNDESKMKLTERLSMIQKAYADFGYTSISLYDNHAMLRLSTAEAGDLVQRHENKRVLESMRSGQLSVSDIHLEKIRAQERANIDLVVPLNIVKMGETRTIGAVLFKIDPSRFIFPLIQNWPTASASSETLLVRRDGDEVVFLNELRHSKNAPLSKHYPISQQQLLETKVVTGQEGLAEGVDYRGVPVVGILNKIPGTPWFMVSKIDTAEIYAPIHKLAHWIIALMLALVIAGGGITVYWAKKERKRSQSELEHERLIKHLDYLSRYANDIILLMDSTGKIVDFNDRALEAYGYTAEELIGLNFTFLRAVEFLLPLVEDFNKIDLAGALRFESMHVRRNGAVFPVESSVRVVDIGGEKFYQAIIRDITERKKAESEQKFTEEALRISLANLKAMLNNTPYMVWFKDTQGRYIQVNKVYVDYTRLNDAEQIIGKTDFDLWPKDFAEKFRLDDAEVLSSRQQKYVEEQSLDGNQLHWVETFKTPVIDDEGNLLGTTGFARDITERKQRDLALQKFEAIVDSTDDAIISQTLDGVIQSWNQGAEKIYGYSTAEVMGKSMKLLIPPERIYEEDEILARLAQGERVDHFETVRQRKDGKLISISATISPIFGGHGRVVGISKIARDITEQKQAESDLLESRKQLRELSSYLQNVREEERTRIARELHDELGQSMTALRFDLMWLGEHVDAQRKDVHEKVEAMRDLVGKTVDSIRRISEDLRPGMLDDLGLAATIENHVEKFSAQYGISCDLAMSEADFDLDPQVATTLFRLVQEALTNVARHSGANNVILRLQEIEDKMYLIVQDNGRGLLAATDPDKKSFGIIGMRERVKILGGTLDIFNEKGAGVRIEACVPKHVEANQ